MKKIFLIILVLFSLAPAGVFAYPGGALQGQTVNVINNATGGFVTTTNDVTDGSLSTTYTLPKGHSFQYFFPQPATVEAIQVDPSTNVTFSFLNEEGIQIYSSGFIASSNRITITPVKNVKEVRVNNISTGAMVVREFDVWVDLPPPPATPTGLTAIEGDKKIDLSWNASAGAGGYNVYSNGQKLTATSISGTSYTVTGLTNGTSYSFQVSAVNLGGESAKSAIVTATPMKIPDIPTGLAAVAGDRKIELSWNASADADGYHVYSSDGHKLTTTPVSGTSYTVTGLTNGTSYSFQVSAVNSFGESSKSAAVGATPMGLPNIPTGLVAKPGDKQANLTWNASANATGYHVYSSDGHKLTTTPISGTSYTVTGLTNGTSYGFQVSAVNSIGESAKSQPVSVKPEKQSRIPTNVNAKAGNAKVYLSWKAVPDATEYRIYRDNVLIDVVGATEYTDLSVINDQVYVYEVTSVVAGEESGRSNQVKSKPGDFIDFGSGSALGPVTDVIQTGWDFSKKYWMYLCVVLGIIFAPTLLSILTWLFGHVRPKKSAVKNKKRKELTAEEKEKRARQARERKLNKARDEKYDQLTRMNRITERDSWVKQTEYLRPEQRQAKAREERDRKAREQRAAAKSNRSSSSSKPRSSKPRSTRKGRSPRGR